MQPEQEEPVYRERCYGCYRPVAQCFCDLIPTIDNRTDVLILQHSRERFHAFNTARIVHKSLKRSTIEVGFTQELETRSSALAADAGLLFPGEDARLIDEVPPADCPSQIVVLDGTWHHAKTMIRDIPWLRELPRFRIAPASPSQYRIRREPTVESLSTVEATVDILRAIEPDTAGFDELLAAFNTMIDRHIDVIGTAQPRHKSGPRNESRVATNISRSLLGDANKIVVAYGESVPRKAGQRTSNVPVVWAARRTGTGDEFYRCIQPPCPLEPTILRHMELDDSAFQQALPLSDFRAAWSAFVEPDDVVFVYSKGTRQLLRAVGIDCQCELLRSIDFPGSFRLGTLSELLTSLDVHPQPATMPGRAGRRLANAVALVDFVRRSVSRC